MNKAYCPTPDLCDSIGCKGHCVLASIKSLPGSKEIVEQAAVKVFNKAFNQPTAADILEAMARTYRERNAVYGDNYKMVGKMMAVLFPQGVPPELVVQDHFHLFELMLVKLSRYAISKLSHQDSIHDLGVYAAMCESITIQLQGEK